MRWSFDKNKKTFKKVTSEDYGKIPRDSVVLFVSDAVTRRCSAKKVILKDLAKFTRKHLCRSLLLIKLQASEHFLYRTTPVTASEFPRRFSKIFRCNPFTSNCKCCFVLNKISKLFQKISHIYSKISAKDCVF